MKFLLNDLKEKTSIEFTYDYSKDIQSIVDILSIEPAKIQAKITYKLGYLMLQITVDVNMELACSLTLKPVPYTMHFEDSIVFGDTEEADYPLTDPLELAEIIFGYIISEKPYTIYHPDADKTLFEKEKSPHPAFADLDKIVKK
jgi:uncharacterized metal-binding protein YceD (DUF177 family)